MVVWHPIILMLTNDPLRSPFFLQWVRLYLRVQFFPLSNKELHQSGFLVQQSCHPVKKNTVSPHKPLSSSFSYCSKIFEPKCRILHLSQLHLILFVWCYWYFKVVSFFLLLKCYIFLFSWSHFQFWQISLPFLPESLGTCPSDRDQRGRAFLFLLNSSFSDIQFYQFCWPIMITWY